MEFGLGEDQRLLDESLRSLLDDAMPLEEVRRIAETETASDPAFRRQLIDLGISGMLVPEDYGGSDLSILDAAIVAEAFGYFAAPGGFLSAAVMAPLTLRLYGTEGQQSEWLPAMASGERRLAIAFGSLAGTNQPGDARFEAGHLTGELSGAIDPGDATDILVFQADGAVALAPLDDAGAAVTLRRTIDRTRPMADIRFDGVSAEILDGANDPKAAAVSVLDAGRVMLAADILGACQSMFDKAVDYAKVREQFGRKIGGFQGVKHQCADMVTMLEPCRSLVWYAAHAQDAVPEERRVVACHAKAHLGEVGRDVATLATEIHGGMGFTDLLGLHYWFKRVSYDRPTLGGPERCRREAAEAEGLVAVE